jgi:23S rRNA pseudouridine2605 synthase
MILTNDGDLANRLAHPRFGVEKFYRALVAGLPSPATLARLTEGVWLSDGKVRAKRARIVGRQGQATQLELVLAEGKKREIRRMLSKLGHKVMSLNRIAIGPISLKGLPSGEWRPLSRHEIDSLRQVAHGGDSVRPGSFETASTSRPRHESRRRRQGERPRGRRDDVRPPLQGPRQGHERQEQRPHPESTAARSRRPRLSRSDGVDRSRPPVPERRPARTNDSGGTKPKTSPPGKSGQVESSTPLPPRPPSIRRRVIGFEQQPAPRAGSMKPSGRRRRSPPAPRRQPPRAGLAKRPNSPSKPRSPDDEGA